MSKRHEVNIMVSDSDGNDRPILKTRKCYLREWLIRKLFGDVREILVLRPGETVQTVAIKEIRGA